MRARIVAVALGAIFTAPLGSAAQTGTELGHGVHTFVDEELYPVKGVSFLEAYREIERSGPVDSDGHRKHGLTSYELVPSWQFVAQRRTCRMQTVTVVARVTVHLPDWTEAGAGDEDSQAAWTRFIAELKAHEYLHRDYVLEAADDLFQKLETLGPRRCDGLRAEAQLLTQQLYTDLQERQAALDRAEGNR